MSIRFDSLTALDKQIDGQTDRRTELVNSHALHADAQ